MSARGVPGLRGTEHIAFSVPDLDQAIAFFPDAARLRVLLPARTVWGPGGYLVSGHFGLDPRTEVTRACVLRCGHGSNFEIFEFTAPEQRREMPKMSDWGGTHLAFYVDDMDAAIAYLAGHGVEVLGGSKPGIDGESGENATFAHFHSPGMLLELVSFPNGKTYMNGRDRVLWHPAPPRALHDDDARGGLWLTNQMKVTEVRR